MSNPNGEYGADDVRVHLNGVEIRKGDNAKGTFVTLGGDGSHTTTSKGADGSVTLNRIHDSRRPLVIAVLRSSAVSNAALGSDDVQRGATLRIERTSGGVLFEGHAFREDSPRNVGDERHWTLVAVGRADDE